MSLACRFCHGQEENLHQSQYCPYSVVLTNGSTEAVVRKVEEIEGLKKVIPGYCVLCDICGRYSMISYKILSYLDGLYVISPSTNTDLVSHYAYLCNNFKNANLSVNAEVPAQLRVYSFS